MNSLWNNKNNEDSSYPVPLMASQIDDDAIGAFLEQPDAVIFVGSGLSCWSGLPNWETLLRGLIDVAAAKGAPVQIAEEAFAAKQLLDAADALQLTPIEIENALRDNLGFSHARPHEIHSLLVNLGPRRFVTTNFDSLIEQELGLQGSLGRFRVVAGRQVAELADIVKASADAFILKPHGDLSDANSMVLTSRDYERLIGTETNHVRRALETILVTRPVLFLGYGLRDPDTSLVLRTIHDRYVGNVGHFAAIVANATDEHRSYWWDRYRIRVFSYHTEPDKKGVQAHAALLELMKRLVTARAKSNSAKGDSTKHISRTSPKAKRELPTENRIALIRYAARLMRPEQRNYFPVKVWFRDWMTARQFSPEITRFHRADISQLFEKCQYSFALSGSAGSGKSFAIAEFMSQCGRRLIDWDKNDVADSVVPPIPLLLDARLYEGAFANLATISVPSELNLVELSERHEIVVILDSLDEMPATELDLARWRSDFESFVAQFKKSRVIYGMRRADLAARNDLAIFQVLDLADDIVRDSLAEVGKDIDQFPAEFRAALKIPFLLSLSRSLLGRRSDIRSAPALLCAFIESALRKINDSAIPENLYSRLIDVAEFLTNAGRETISLRDIVSKFLSKTKQELGGSPQLVDSLVAAGILISEVDGHVRFVHRTVTEYLTAEGVIESWRTGKLDLFNKLSFRRWDNSVVWAVSMLNETEAERFTHEVYRVDPVLAFRIAAAAEVGATRPWLAFLDAASRQLPTQEQMHEIVYAMEDGVVVVPAGCTHKLKELMTKDADELGGWAAAQYVSYASDDELRSLIDRFRAHAMDWNYTNHSGHALGSCLSESLVDYLLQALESTDLGEWDPGSSTRFAFEATIGGLTEDNLMKVLRWARAKGGSIRNVICSAIREREHPEVDRFLFQQLDRGEPSAIYGLAMRLRYQNDRTSPARPPTFTQRRFDMLLANAIKTPPKSGNWSIMLLQECGECDVRWAAAIMQAGRSHVLISVRRSMKILDPWVSQIAKERFVYYALRNVLRLSSIERAVFHEICDDDLNIREDDVLSALSKFGKDALELISECFRSFRKGSVIITAFRLDDWLNVLSPFGESDYVEASWISSHLASRFSDDGRIRIIERANDPKDPARKYILGSIVPRMTTVTTDDLSAESASRLLDLYIAGKLEPWPSPGSIATEQFITEVVLPMASDIGSDKYRRESFETILNEAGQRHDRRYFAPWQVH